MQQGTRKFFTNERSVPKESRASYQQLSNTQKDVGHPYYAQYGIRKELTKTSSDADLKHPKQQYFKNLNQRRKNEGQMSNLKSQLQNLKNEVNKLISKESALRTPQKQRSSIKQQRSDKKINYVSKGYHDEFTDRQQDFSDTASMTSVTTEKVLNEPLRRLQKKVTSQNYEPGYYMQLENQLLKTEIKNLKNKYVSKKRQLTEKCELLEKKNEYLEVSLQKSEEALVECRKALEMEIMVIKRQITLKTQIKNVDMPESDRPKEKQQSSQGNELLQQKLRRLYQQMNQKNKHINNLSIQLGDLQTVLQRKKFQLKKQSQKSLQLSKQLQLSKRQNSRLQILVQTQISKKKDIVKENDSLKEKNKELVEEIYKKEQIVTGSEQYQNRITEELQQYKKKQDELQLSLSTARQENKKLKQLISTNNDEIALLKKTHDDTLARIAQLSKKLKEEQQRSMQRQDYYRKLIEETKQKEQEKFKILKEHYEQQSLNRSMENLQVREQSQQMNDLLREKERQINKWKAEYKILKLKHEQKFTSDKMKKQEIQMYYKGFVQYKQSSQLLEEKNKILESSINGYSQKLRELQAETMRMKQQHNKDTQELKQEITRLKHQIENLSDELQLSKAQLAEANHKNQEQTKYRQQVQGKIEKFIHQQLHGESDEDEEHMGQYQNSSTEDLEEGSKNSKRFLEDDGEHNEEPKKHSTKKPKQQPTLTQSQKLQLEQLSESITTVKKRIIQQDQKLSKGVRQLKNKDAQINKLKKQIRQLLQTHEKQLAQIKQKYSSDKLEVLIKQSMQSQNQAKQICQKEVQLHKTKYAEILTQNVQMKRRIQDTEKELLDLRQQTKSLSHLYNVKCSEVEEISEKNLNELHLRQRKIDELQTLRQQRQTNLLNEISNLKDEISILRMEIKSLTSINNKMETNNFDEALKNQIQTSKTLRQELTKKNEEVFKVRDNYTLLRSQYDNLRSQSQIQKLKNLSQKKNLEVQYQIQVQNLKNKLSVEQKKISSLQQKISLVIEQNKKKDSFIQSYIMGKKLPQGDKEFVAEFIKQYQIQLNGKSINQKLRADSHELEKMATYNYRLLKDMAQMKEKMLLYETMEGEALSLYDSRQSGEVNRQNDFDSPNSQSSRSPRTPNKRFRKMNSLVDVAEEY